MFDWTCSCKEEGESRVCEPGTAYPDAVHVMADAVGRDTFVIRWTKVCLYSVLARKAFSKISDGGFKLVWHEDLVRVSNYRRMKEQTYFVRKRLKRHVEIVVEASHHKPWWFCEIVPYPVHILAECRL